MTDLTDVLDGLMADVASLPAVGKAAELRVRASRLADALWAGTPSLDAARALEEAAVEALEQDGWFRVYRTARRIVTALTIASPVKPSSTSDHSTVRSNDGTNALTADEHDITSPDVIASRSRPST
jgi:hypothetical protein